MGDARQKDNAATPELNRPQGPDIASMEAGAHAVPILTTLNKRLVAATAFCMLAAACADSDDSPTAPSPAPTPGAASIAVQGFTATYSPNPNGTLTYRVAFTLRESAGTGANLSTVTLTLTQTGGATAATDYTATEAFGTTRIAANGTVTSNPVTFTGPPVAASQLAVRVAYTDDTGRTGAAQATTAVTAASTP